MRNRKAASEWDVGAFAAELRKELDSGACAPADALVKMLVFAKAKRPWANPGACAGAGVGVWRMLRQPPNAELLACYRAHKKLPPHQAQVHVTALRRLLPEVIKFLEEGRGLSY